MKDISFDEEDFIVTSKINDLGEHTGIYRVIRYSTGYYALQHQSDDDGVEYWRTICVSPTLDTPLDTGYDWKFSQGRLDMNNLLFHLKNSSKLQDNELMELHLHLNSDLDEDVRGEIIHTIKSKDGRDILDKIHESLQFQDELLEENLKNKTRWSMVLIIYLIIVTLIILAVTLL